MKLAIINGPNLNLTGIREPQIYGAQDFDTFIIKLKKNYPAVEISYFQSNIEGEIIDELHQKGFTCDGIILNAGAYTHTSIAIADAIKAIKAPVIEVHMSNVLSRENYRHSSLTGINCKGSIIGFGMQSYQMAVTYFINLLY